MTALPTPPASVLAALRSLTSKLTIEEFFAKHGGESVEYVDGVVKELPVASRKHGKICCTFARVVGNFVDDHDLGHVMSNDSFVQTTPTKVRGADVCYFSYERLPRGEVPEGDLRVAPDLVGEVKSPTDRWIDVFAKVVEYLNAGVRVVILVDPETRTASVYRLPVEQTIFEETDTLTIPDVLPGFSLPVARLFA